MNTADDSGRELGGDEAVAAEYVLGTLAADERATAARRIESDAAFAQLVDRWEVTLAPMGAGYAPAEPPASVKQAVDRRLFERAAAPAKPSMWQSLALWRGLTVASFLALAAYAAMPLIAPTPPDEPPTRLVASLAPQQSDVHYFVVYDATTRDIGLSHVTGARAEGHDFELWVIEDGQAPKSLGVIPSGSNVHLAVSEDVRRKIASGAVFAISLEPVGGSTTGAPTGPVVAAGDLRSI
ncbi:MAG: anti-sigma factor [Mesorhizobium sp.]|nr:anti-sigma factor [Mesorhizobium sp.]